MLTAAGKKKIKARQKEPRSAVNPVTDVNGSARLFQLRRRNASVHLPIILASPVHSHIARGKPSSTPVAGTIKHRSLRELEKVQQAQNRPDRLSKGIPSKWYYSFLSKIQRHQKVVNASTPVAVAEALEPAGSPTSQSPSALGTSIPSASTPNSALSITSTDNDKDNKVTPRQVHHPGPITQQFIEREIQGSSENLLAGREAERIVGSYPNAHVAKSSKSVTQAPETGQQEHIALITPPGRARRATQEPQQPPQEASPPQPPHRAGVGSMHNGSDLYSTDNGKARGLIGRDPNTDSFPASSGAADSNLMGPEAKQKGMMGVGLVAGATGEKTRVGRAARDTEATSDGACKGTSVGGTGPRGDAGRPSWDLAATERAGVTLTRGMRVLCLDIFVSKIGGGEVRRWRPAEIAQVFKEHPDELVVRVDFFSYGDSTESICLRLRDEWTRLASALSLTEEEMIAGTPLEGDALNASKKLFKPRSDRRKSGQANTTETSKPNKSAKPGSSEALAQTQRTGEAESSAQSGTAIVGSEGSRRRQPQGGNRSGSGGDEQGEGSGQGLGRSWRRRGSDGGVPGGRGGLDKAGGEAEGRTAAIAAAFVAALTAAKQVDSSDNGSGSGSGKGRRKMKGIREKQDDGGQQDPGIRALVTSVSLPESLEVKGAAASSQQEVEGQTTSTAMTTARAPGSSSSKSRRDAISGAASKASSRTSGSGGGKTPAEGTSAGGSVSGSAAEDLDASASSLIQSRRLRLLNGSAEVAASKGGQVRGRDGHQRDWEQQVGREASAGTGTGGLGGALAVGSVEGTERRKQRWTVWEMSRSRPPAIGDRFDCLDYFTSSQSLTSVCKWREAEVGAVRATREETRVDMEILVHYVKWSDKWDRWISFTRERERFAPYMTRAVPLGATSGQSGSPGGSRRQRKGPRGGGGDSSTSRSNTLSGAHRGTHDGVFYGHNISGDVSYPVGHEASHGISYGGSTSSGAVIAGAGGRNLTHPHGFTGGARDAARGPPYGASRLLVGQQGGGSSNNDHINGARYSSHSMGEGRGVNNSISNAGSGSGRSSSTTSSSSSGSGGASVGNGSCPSVGVEGIPAMCNPAMCNPAMCSPATSSQESTSEDDEASADALFREAMDRKGLHIIDVEPDGNCLFRSVSHQVFGDAERHLQVRAACVKHMTKHKARFGVFFAGNFTDYLFHIKRPAVWGDDLEIRALEEMLDRPIEIYSSDAEDLRPMKIDFDAAALDVETAPIKLSYHGQSHYNSVRDKSIAYPLKLRRSKNILRMREAQHARTPRSSAADASGSSSTTGQDQGIRRPRGGGFGTEGKGNSSSRRSWKDPRRFTGDSATLLGSSGVSKSEGVSKSGEGDGGGGGAANASNGSITKNFAGMVYRTMSRGGVSNRKGGV